MKVKLWSLWHFWMSVMVIISTIVTSACAPAGTSAPTPAPGPTFLGLVASRSAEKQVAVIENPTSDKWFLKEVSTHWISTTASLVAFNRPFDFVDFSPDDKYVLFEGADTWWQTNPDGSTSRLAQDDNHIRFARYWPDGSLLIGSSVVTGTLSGTLSLRVVDPGQLNSTRLQKDRARYSFTTQLPDLAKLRSITPLIPAIVTCPSITEIDQDALLMIQADGSADLLVATRSQPADMHSHFALSPDNLAILQQQDAIITHLLAAYASFAADSEVLTSSCWTNSNLGGVLSPDVQHPRLLFLLVDVSKNTPLYTLYLMDLLDEQGQPQELSSRTTWVPSFSFSPDGSQILYETEENVKHKLYRANADGTNRVLIAENSTGQACWH